MVSSIVPNPAYCKIPSSRHTQRTFCGDMYIIRINLLDLFPNHPRHCPGKFDFVILWAINIAVPPGINIINSITIENRTRFNIFVRCDHTVNLRGQIVCYYQYFRHIVLSPSGHLNVQLMQFHFQPNHHRSYIQHRLFLLFRLDEYVHR